MTLSFAERFELGSSGKERLLIRGSLRILVELVLNCVFRASSAFKLFGAGLRSPELCFSGHQCLQVIRGWASVPRIVFSGRQCLQVIRGWASVPRIVLFGPAVPSSYSRLGFGPSNCLFGPAVPSSYSRLGFGPSNCLFQASSAFRLFEAGLRSLELSFFRPAVPSGYSRLGFGPSNCLFRPSNAFKVFELELRIFESLLSSRQRHYTIRAWVSEPSKRIPRPSASSFCLSMG
jgi:hypothetical protein